MISKVFFSFVFLMVFQGTPAPHVICNDDQGVTYVECPNTSSTRGGNAGGGGGGAGGGGAGGGRGGGGSSGSVADHRLVECCKDYIYTGPGTVHYDFPGLEAYDLTITDLKLKPGEEIIIKKFACVLIDECRQLIIDSTAKPKQFLRINGPRFTVSSKRHKSVYMKFRVHRHDCECSPVCDVDNGWVLSGDHCYKLHKTLYNWSRSQTECYLIGGHLAAPQEQSEFDYLQNVAAAENKGLYVGTISSNGGTTWENADGTAVDNTFWAPGYPDRFQRHANCVCLDSARRFKGLYNCNCDLPNGLYSVCQK